MKKSLLALAVLSAFAGAASAQSSVTLSGRVDAGIVREYGDWTMRGSQSGYNALTFSGREDLGGGMYAFFALNHRFNINSGTNNPGGNAGGDTNQFYRNAAVGLGGGFGDIRLGRILMPLQDMNGGYDPFDTGYVASTHTGGIKATVRANNAIYYRTPSLGGFFVHAAIAAGDQQNFAAGTYSSSKERPTGLGLGYTGGPVRVGLAWDKNGADLKTIGLYGAFNAGFATFMGQFEKGDVSTSADVKRWSLGAKVPLGAVTVKAGFTKWTDEKVKKFGVGAQYDLSKRTNIYTDIGKYSGSGAGVVLSTPTAPVTQSKATKATFDLGVSHAF
jgi:predicted porin